MQGPSYALQVWKGCEHIWGPPHLFVQPSLKAYCFLSILITTCWPAGMFVARKTEKLSTTKSLKIIIRSAPTVPFWCPHPLVSFRWCFLHQLCLLLQRNSVVRRVCLSFKLEHMKQKLKGFNFLSVTVILMFALQESPKALASARTPQVCVLTAV